MPAEDVSHAFDMPDFWRSSRWVEPSLAPVHMHGGFFDLDIKAEPRIPPPPDSTALPLNSDGFFKLPAMLEPRPLDSNVTNLDNCSHTLPPESIPEVDDLWLPSKGLPGSLPAFRTWDQLDSRGHDSSAPKFVTEAGPEVFDAIVASQHPGNRFTQQAQNQLVKPSAFCSCLLALALGRDSALFAWNPQKRSFAPASDCLKISGHSDDVLQGIKHLCLECGNNSRFLAAFVEGTYSTNPTPCRVALANAINILLATILDELGSRGRNVRSLIQLQMLVRPVRSLLQFYRQLVDKISGSISEEALISLLFEEAQSVEHGDVFLRDTVKEVLQAVSKPFLEFAAQWVGLAPETGVPISREGPGKSFVSVENRVWIDDMGFELEEADYFLDEEHMPAFIPREVARSIFETGRNLRFLRTNKPRHFLSGPKISTHANPPSLRWLFDWKSITRAEHKAVGYEKTISRAIERFASTYSQIRSLVESSTVRQQDNLQFFGRDELQIESRILASMAEFDQPLSRSAANSLAVIVQRRLFDSLVGDTTLSGDITPPWSLTPLLSFGPIVSAQARVVNHECMKLLFGEHNVREHLTLLRSFQLLGNGVFCSRLTHALFNPDLDPAERQSGVTLSGGVMGLRLEGRANWPPASSELRLALMGVLSESYEPSGGKKPPCRSVTRELPGDLSFAVRDLSPEEMEKCMNPKSIEALDFLRLTYKPPAPLRPILTPMVLAKLDRIFKLLLRVLRMLYVTNQLFRDGSAKATHGSEPSAASYRFRIEARHFISSITTYFFDAGIAVPWQRFEGWLDRIQSDLEGPWEAAGQSQSHSPDLLRERHEGVLDEIMSVLLLRKKQQAVLKLLEDIFRVILQFAEWSRAHAGGQPWNGNNEDADGLYVSFRKKVDVFITVCRAMSEKGGSSIGGERRGDTQGVKENTISQLLLVLDMHDHEWRGKPAA